MCSLGGKSKKSKNQAGMVRVKANLATEKAKDYPDFKLLMIGDPGVGKSSLLLKYADNEFTDNFISTIGVDYKEKRVRIKDGSNVPIQIWDTAGQERFRTITSSYYRGAHGIILTFDLTNPTTFKSCTKWLQEVDRYADEDVVVILAGNKCDLDPKVDASEIEEFKTKYSWEYCATSAKTGTGVNEIFLSLTEAVVERYNETQ